MNFSYKKLVDPRILINSQSKTEQMSVCVYLCMYVCDTFSLDFLSAGWSDSISVSFDVVRWCRNWSTTLKVIIKLLFSPEFKSSTIGQFLQAGWLNSISLERYSTDLYNVERYRRSDNPIKSYKHLSKFYMPSWSRMLNFTMKKPSGIIKKHLVTMVFSGPIL